MPFQQLTFLFQDVQRMVNIHWWRWFTIWFGAPFLAVFSYRFNRFGYLLFGRIWSIILVVTVPIGFMLRPFFPRCEIHYRADIGGGLNILHPSLGVVISARTTAGRHLTLTGGNCIGNRTGLDSVTLGDHVTLGANASLLGSVTIGSHVQIGMGAVVIDGCGDNETLVGVPARPVRVKSA